MQLFISICIPAYKRVNYLNRLLQSIQSQTYKDFEIIISDDSPDNSVAELIKQYASLPIIYIKNTPALGTPANWNKAISLANADWIKIMHDDDWLANNDSLAKFVQVIENNSKALFIFSAYNNVYEINNKVETVFLSKHNETMLRRSELYFFRSNYVGNPSCTLFKKNNAILFDTHFKWVVDFEFYMRYFKQIKNNFVYINEALINVGMNDTQVTNYTFRINKVEIPENHLMLEKIGMKVLKNILVYDYFWRLYRNLDIKQLQQIADDGFEIKKLPIVLQSMIQWQSFIPNKVLKFGSFSKTIMMLHYFLHFYQIK